MSKLGFNFIPEKLEGRINLPASKSISNRLLIIRALSYQWFEIENLSESEDTKILNEILTSNQTEFNVGDAGTAMRFLTAYLSGIVGEWTLTGSARMQERPIGPLVDALNSLGADIRYTGKKGFPPLTIFGMKLTKKMLEVNGAISSQYITALMLIAPTLLNGMLIKIKGELVSKPYVEMTRNLLRYFGVHCIYKNNSIEIESQNYAPKNIRVEPDWSAASYWYEMVALAEKADIKIPYLSENSLQGDAILAEIYEFLGVQTTFNKKGIRLTKMESTGNRIDYNLEKYPDISLALVVTAALKKIPFRFSGLQSLKIKECNRIEALQNELQKFSVKINEIENGVLECHTYPEAFSQQEIVIDTYNDHRIAMAFAPAAIINKNIVINNPEVVKKSYPGFWDDLKKVGFGW
jgi:3-phosphoshikimate 1-carboxyvinyltransferase